MPQSNPSNTTVACLQMEPTFGDPDRNRLRIAELIERACGMGARIVVAPELGISGYAFRSRDEAFGLSEEADGPTAANWASLAARHDIYVVGGICEREADRLYNSAIVVGPRGLIGTYRKNHLWDDENRFFQPGDLGFPVFETPFGRVGVLICYDLWFPEAFRSCVLNGADLVCVPTAWLPIPGRDPNRDPMHNVLAMAAAHASSVPVACADRIGRENGKSFIGQSVIVNHTGWPVAGPASAGDEEILIATLDLARARRERRWSEFNDLVKDRRPEIYRLG